LLWPDFFTGLMPFLLPYVRDRQNLCASLCVFLNVILSSCHVRLLRVLNKDQSINQSRQQAVRVATQYAPAPPAAAHLQSIAHTPYACGAKLHEYS